MPLLGDHASKVKGCLPVDRALVTLHAHCHGSFATLDPEHWPFRQEVLLCSFWSLMTLSCLLVAPMQFLEALMTLANNTPLPNP